MNVVIRKPTLADVEGIAHVHVQGWRESYAGFLSADALAGLSVGERAEMWHGILAESDARVTVLLATLDGEIVGFAAGGPVRSKGSVPLDTEAELYAIYLLSKVKRQGIGRRLVLGIFDHLAAQGFRSCGLWVLSRNADARRFYESLGAAAGSEQPITLRGEIVSETAYRFEPLPHH